MSTSKDGSVASSLSVDAVAVGAVARCPDPTGPEEAGTGVAVDPDPVHPDPPNVEDFPTGECATIVSMLDRVSNLADLSPGHTLSVLSSFCMIVAEELVIQGAVRLPHLGVLSVGVGISQDVPRLKDDEVALTSDIFFEPEHVLDEHVNQRVFDKAAEMHPAREVKLVHNCQRSFSIEPGPSSCPSVPS